MDKIDLDSATKQNVLDELNRFSVHDESLRTTIVESGKTFDSFDRLDPAATYLSNTIMREIRNCRKNGILFPVNYMMIYDILYYLEHYYYHNLDAAMDDLGTALTDYTNLNIIKRFLHGTKYSLDVLEKRLELICKYNNVADYINLFDITRDGDKVLDYALESTDFQSHHKVIGYHRAYHEKMNNVDMLRKIK